MQESYLGPNVIRPYTELWGTLHNISGSLSPACLANPPRGIPILCAFPHHILDYLDHRIRLFISQSMADVAQQYFVLLGCDPSIASGPEACDAKQLAFLDNFRLQMISALQPVINGPTGRYGLFAPECSIHVIEDDDGSWAAVRVEGQTQRETFQAWYAGDAGRRSIVVDGVWGSNPTCAAYTATDRGVASHPPPIAGL